MLASITPLGERGRNNRWGLTVAAYVIGSVAGGALIGAALGALGEALRGVGGEWLASRWAAGESLALALLALVALVGLVADRKLWGTSLPTLRRQVDERWLDEYRGWVYGFGFGFQLGLGVATIVTASITYVALAAAFLSASWLGGMVIGAAFGLARAVPLMLTRGVREPAALVSLHRSADRWQAPVARLTEVAQAGAALIAALGAIFVLR